MYQNSLRISHARCVVADSRNSPRPKPQRARRRIALAIAALFACDVACATTITVTDGGDAGTASTCTLRQAIASANTDDAGTSTCVSGSGADVIVFEPALVGSTITLQSGELQLLTDITLSGSGQIIDAQNASRVMYAGRSFAINPYQITVSGMTLQHGDALSERGGGVAARKVKLTLANLTIANNKAVSGAGVWAYQSDLTLAQSTISGNTATNHGPNVAGGLDSRSNGTLVLDHVQMSGNSAQSDKAGATVVGGVLEYGSAQVSIRYSVIANNRAFSDNAATGNGISFLVGGVFAGSSGNLSITQSLLQHNGASAAAASAGSGVTGGAFVQFCSNASLRNVTLTQNYAQAFHSNYGVAGGLQLTTSGASQAALVSNVTISANSASTLDASATGVGGALVSVGNGSIDIRNSIDSGNSGPAAPDLIIANTAPVLRSNLLGSALQATLQGNGNLFADDPRLGGLADNGGPTPTMALFFDSPAFDAGDNALLPAQDTTDQRGAGFPRLAGSAVDIGAFEAPGERTALMALYLATGGDTWTDNTGWCAGACPATGTPTFNAVGTECTWTGVTCELGHVVGLSLPGNHLQGGPLRDLTALTELTDLQLGGNAITGPLPDLHVLAHLGKYALAGNQFSGALPANLPTWPALAEFRVGRNGLTGTIPPLAGLNTLRFFDASHNGLSGSVPALASLSQLNTLILEDNLLTGTLPALPTNIQVFLVDQNQLSGTLPSFAGLAQLTALDFHSNGFSGSLPSLAGLSSLSFAVFADNQLSGAFPDLSGSNAIGYLDVSYNQLSGALPDLRSTNLVALYVQNNRFVGAVPNPPPALSAHHTALCPNRFTLAAGPNDAAWNAATGLTPWWGPAGAGCDAIWSNGLELLSNGSFEHGLTGWQIGSGTCLWQTVPMGTAVAGFGGYLGWIAPMPLDGKYALVSDEQNSGSCTLYQDVTVPAGFSGAQLSAAVGYNIGPGDTQGCSASVALTTPSGTPITSYVTLTAATSVPLLQYAPTSAAVQPGEVVRVNVTIEPDCPAFPAGIVLDAVQLTLM